MHDAAQYIQKTRVYDFPRPTKVGRLYVTDKPAGWSLSLGESDVLDLHAAASTLSVKSFKVTSPKNETPSSAERRRHSGKRWDGEEQKSSNLSSW